MIEERAVGYSQEEYYAISSKDGLPKRCPILKKCCKAVRTRWVLGFEVVGTKTSFEDFLSFEGQYWEPEKMIPSVEQMQWLSPEIYGDSGFFYAYNICPEVTLFEEYYLPDVIIPSACGKISYYYESKRAIVTPKHYSECAEFSGYYFTSIGQRKTKMSASPKQINEQVLEDYLVDNLSLLEPGLKFLDRQKPLGKWKVDIFASDTSGADVLIELKSKILSRGEIDKLCGQVSRYYHRHKSKVRDVRMFIVIPKDKRDMVTNLYHGLKSWIDGNKVTVFQFDYTVYSKEFAFTKVTFENQ